MATPKYRYRYKVPYQTRYLSTLVLIRYRYRLDKNFTGRSRKSSCVLESDHIDGQRRGRMHHMQRHIASAWLERDPLWPHLPLGVFEALARAEANVPALQIRLQGWLDKGATGASANCSSRGSQDARPR